MHSPFHHNLEQLAGPASWHGGVRLFREGAVLDLCRQGRAVVEARVANDTGAFEHVTLAFRTRNVHAECTCLQPRFICDHAVAAMLRVAEQMPDLLESIQLEEADTPFQRDTEIIPVERQSAAGRRSDLDVRDFLLGEIVQPGGAPPAYPASLTLRLPAPLPSLDTRWGRVTAKVGLRFHGRDYAATNIRCLVAEERAAGGMRLSDFSPQERRILLHLRDWLDGSGPEICLQAHGVAELLHLLTGFRGVYVGEEILRVHAERLQPVLVCRGAAKGKSIVAPKLQVCGCGSLLPRECVRIVGRIGCWVGTGCDFWWLPGVIPNAWLRFFAGGHAADLSAEEAARLHSCCAAMNPPMPLVPGESAIELAGRRGRCRPVLLLDWDEHGICAVLEFDYAGTRVTSGDPLILWEHDRFVSRDERSESRSRRRLSEYGFAARRGHPGRFLLSDPSKIWCFVMDGTDSLAKEHWQVLWSPAFSRKKAATGPLTLEVTTTDETRSWFELRCRPTARDGTLLAWEKIFEDMQETGQSCILSPEGGVVRIDGDLARTTLAALKQWGMRQGTDTFRFHACMAVRVEGAVRPHLQGKPANWQALAEQLCHPERLECRTLPPEFQGTLRPYQKEGLAWLEWLETVGLHGVLADEMGLGKTIQALALLALRVFVVKVGKPSLIVCPTSLMENWAMEAARFVPSLRTVVVRGPDRQGDIERSREYDLAITSYALLRRDLVAYQGLELDYVILDEAQHIKNPATVNARTCKALNSERRLILTGTPIENSLFEIWSLFDFLLPGYLGSQSRFRARFGTGAATGMSAESVADVARHIRPFMLRRTKAAVCSQLPPKLEQILYCELGEEQRRIYDDVLLQTRSLFELARAGGWEESRFELLSLLLRLRQICCHPDLLPARMRRGYPASVGSAKMDLACEMMLEAVDGSHRILLFSQFTSLLALLRTWLDAQGVAYEYLDGSTQDRLARVQRFNSDPSIPIFLLSLKAGGTGLNLTGANTVIHYDLWWNPMVEDQATDRTHRIGQTRTVTSIKLVTRHTIEERVLALQEGKREMIQQLLAGVPAKGGELTPQDVGFLLER